MTTTHKKYPYKIKEDPECECCVKDRCNLHNYLCPDESCECSCTYMHWCDECHQEYEGDACACCKTHDGVNA